MLKMEEERENSVRENDEYEWEMEDEDRKSG